MENKRQNSILVPYKIQNGGVVVYLQKRSKDAKRLPDYFGFFGGGIEEGESPEKALLREIKEEMGLDLNLESVRLFNRYEFIKSIKYTYLFEPSENWEDSVIIGEGEYGQWFTVEDALSKHNIILEDKVILNDLERKLLNKPTGPDL